MNGITRRLTQLEGDADNTLGVCVACIAHAGHCTRPDWEGSRRCGRDRKDLPALLFPAPTDIEAQTPEGRSILERRRKAAADLEAWNKAICEEAVEAGLDEEALRFLKERVLR